MKSYKNVKEIRRKETLGRRLSLSGLGVLFIGLLASFVPTWLPPDQPAATPITQFLQQNWTWLSFAALPIGFLLASLGSYYINRFASRRWPGIKTIARPDELLERNMKGFDDKYAYFAHSLPANYVVTGPCGVLIFAVRGDRGRVNIQGDHWKEPFSLGRLFTLFAREGLGNPAREIEEQAGKLRSLLGDGSTTDEAGANSHTLAGVPVEGAVVFLHPQVDLTVENPSPPALRADQVKEYIRRRTKEAKVQPDVVRRLTERLVQAGAYQEETEASA